MHFNTGRKHPNRKRPPPFTNKHRKNMSLVNIGKKLSEEHKRKIGLANSISQKGKPKPWKRGEKNWNWKGGTTKLAIAIRNLLEYKIWRDSVFIRDKYTCLWCKKYGEKLNADHIKPLSVLLKEYNIKTLEEARNCKELWDINNGRTLCIPCHKTTDTFGNKKKY